MTTRRDEPGQSWAHTVFTYRCFFCGAYHQTEESDTIQLSRPQANKEARDLGWKLWYGQWICERHDPKQISAEAKAYVEELRNGAN